MRDPSLLAPEVRSVASYPGGHNEGFADTFKHMMKKVYDYIRAGDFSKKPDFPTFADGHYELLLNEAIEKSYQTNQWVTIGSTVSQP